MIDSNSNLPAAFRLIWLASALLAVVLAAVNLAGEGRSVAVVVGLWVSLVAWVLATVGLWVVLFI